ncbi:phosphate signaling complex protein PhoU [Actinospongicola halichondriae]|uniref:phosphate signaling complex protein PhoU n=1 Tax=Actinospongicola halichondriae TaxID=3236844 RepID=UPI003D3AC1FD
MNELRPGFHGELDAVMRDITRLAAHVTEAIPRGTQALLDGDLQAAQAMIDHDDVIDDLSIEIEERCYGLLVLQAPVASDLRAIIAAIRLVAEIERSADLMVNVCKGARRIYPTEMPPSVRGLLQQMSEQAAKLFKMCMDAYNEGDAALAAALDDIDDRLDDLHADYIQAVLEWGRDAGDIQPAVQLALIGRYYERIGDHAVNIGERVRYMVDGWLPEHAGAARVHATKPVWSDDTGDPAGGAS